LNGTFSIKDKLSKYVIPNLPYFMFFWFFTKMASAYRIAPGIDAGTKLVASMTILNAVIKQPLTGLTVTDLLIGLVGAVIIRAIVYFKGKDAKKYRKGVEYGSARWGTPEDIKPYIDPAFDKNVILTQTERLMMDSRPSSPKYARNKNILVIGGSGSGKTRFFLKPNLMQMHSSYVVVDPKGLVLQECGKLLERGVPKMKEKLDKNGKTLKNKKGDAVLEVAKDENGKIIYQPYRIKVLNTINFAKSMHYNPFAYIRSEKDILKLVTTIIANTRGEGEKSAEDFWVKAEKLYYSALIGYIFFEAPEHEKNFITLLEMINASETREDDENYKNAVDLLFDGLAEKEPDHFAVRQYVKYKMAAGVIRYRQLINQGYKNLIK